jgi:uncharacterized membrane protein YkvA (DUF1232 family)
MRVDFQRIIENWKKQANYLKQESYALYLVCKHPQTPWYTKALTGIIVAYIFSPVDLIPDFIPILGYLDDLVLVPLGISLVLKMIPESVKDECRKQAQAEENGHRQVNWLAALIIIFIWVGIVFLVIKRLIELFF